MLFSSWGAINVPTKTRILDIIIFMGTFCSHDRVYQVTHTHTHTHAQIIFN